jgi:hypothetical protein
MSVDEGQLNAEPPDAAAEAFEQLREEVAQLRGVVEAMADRLGDSAPDYTPTLAAMAETLAGIEAHPALQYTPHRFHAEASSIIEAIRGRFENETQRALQTIGSASSDIRRHAGELRSRQGQREAILYAASGGLIAGAALWVLLSGPAARALPSSWHIPERMAAATLHMTMWEAGGRLMQASNLPGWQDLVNADRLRRDNAAALTNCNRAADKVGQAQSCRVTVSPR